MTTSDDVYEIDVLDARCIVKACQRAGYTHQRVAEIFAVPVWVVGELVAEHERALQAAKPGYTVEQIRTMSADIRRQVSSIDWQARLYA